MISGPSIAAAFAQAGVSHVVWIPDSTLGTWEPALEQSRDLKLLRVAREGEAWALAAGLWIGGQQPLVVMQNTGLFESGDALRNVLFDLRLPLYALIGYRSYLLANSPDTARAFTEPVLQAWGLEYLLATTDDDVPALVDHYHACRQAARPGIGLIAEGRG
jgi:sulfopyruvate decarboxylase TPP-binding subunit